MSVDSRIVTMKFDNAQFEQGAKTTMSTLDKLKQSLTFGNVLSGATKGLSTMSSILGKFGIKIPFSDSILKASGHLSSFGSLLGKIGIKNPFATATTGVNELGRSTAAVGNGGFTSLQGGVESVSKSFIAMSTIAITALSNITSSMISSGSAWLKSFTIAPVMDGLHEYETTLQSIQTVQANTDAPLSEVEASLQRLNAYSDTTIYNFGEMAKNVGTFTAAGVDLKTSVASIQGIANIAALSGSSSQQAATAMYQLSQAISSGKVGLMDWNSVVNAGMGGKKLQTALATTAVAMGAISKESFKMEGPMKKVTIAGASFRESIMAKPGQESWLSSEILVNTLASLDGRFSVAYQKAQLTEDGVRKFTDAQIKSNMAEARANLEKKNGVKYTDAQYAALLKMADASTSAAQDVKTLGQVFDIAKETIGSGWAASFKSIFGGLDESKKLFTGMSNGLGELIRANALARNKLLVAWHDGGGRDTLIEGLKSAWTAFSTVLGTVGDAFRDVFPAKTASDLIGMTDKFAAFTKSLIPGKDTLEGIKDTARGVFAIFSIIGKVIGGVASMFGRLFSAIGSGSGGFLKFTGGIGDVIVRFNEFLAKSDLIGTFFRGLGDVLAIPIKLLAALGKVLASVFTGFDTSAADKIGQAVGGISEKLTPLETAADKIKAGFQRVVDFLSGIGSKIADALGGIGSAMANAITPDTFSGTLDVINTTLLGGIVLMIRKFMNGGMSVDLTGGLFDGIKQTLGEATSALQNMQQSLKADILIKIAVALGILAASLAVLSMIDGKSLTKALTAMGVGFGALATVLVYLTKAINIIGATKLPLIAGSMIALAASLLILSLSLKILSSIPFGDMLKGLIGLGAMLYILQKAMGPMSANSKGMIRAAVSLTILGVALGIMAVALKIFASMSWAEMAKGLVGMTGALVLFAGALRLMPKTAQLQAIVLVALAGALVILAGALKLMATMSWGELTKGLVGVAAALVIIAGAIRLMPATMLLQAAGLVAVGVALNLIGAALVGMGGMSWEEIGKGLVTLAGALLILAVGLNAIGLVGIAGATALVIAAAALAVLAPIIITLGNLKWETIVKGLAALAGTFLILGVAGLLLAPLVPVLIGLGAAMTLIGAGLALAGAGAAAFAGAFGVVVAAGSAGIRVMTQILGSIVQAIPKAFKAVAQGIVGFVVTIAKGGPKFVSAMSKIISNMLDAIIKNVPKMGKAFLVMLNTALHVVVSATPKIVNAGLTLIVKFLQAISKNVPKIVNIAADIIVKFLNGIAKNIGRIIQSGVNLIVKFIDGVSRAIDSNSARLGAAGGRLAVAVVRGMASGIANGLSVVRDAAINLAHSALDAAKGALGIHSPSREFAKIGEWTSQGMAEGITSKAKEVAKASEGMGKTALSTMQTSMSRISEAVSDNLDFDPTIRPVLDLTQMTQEANRMASLLAVNPISAQVSYQRAADISQATQASQQAEFEASQAATKEVTLTQYNYSPKAIGAVETYRNTKSLLSLAKEAL